MYGAGNLPQWLLDRVATKSEVAPVTVQESDKENAHKPSALTLELLKDKADGLKSTCVNE